MQGVPGVDVSVVIPGYNEERNVENAVTQCLRALEKLECRHEIVVVNDASTDRTGEVADSLAARFPTVRVIHNPINLNVGISVLIGMRAAKGGLIMHNSMDLPFDPHDIGRAVKVAREADVVVVVRTGREAHSLWRQLTSFVHHWMVRILFWTDVRDMNFVQVYRREVLQSLPVKAKSPAFVTPELIIRAKRAGYRMVEIEAKFHRREFGSANFGRPRDILWTLSDMLSFWLEGGGRK